MRINHTAFGKITIDGKTYDHDVIIRLSGEIVKRKKKLSKKLYGTSHTMSEEEAKFVFEKGCEQLILGSGQEGDVGLSPEAEGGRVVFHTSGPTESAASREDAPAAFLGGCGRGRYRNPDSHQCRGPADFSH